MTSWNPNEPSVIGPEFAAIYDQPMTIIGRQSPVVQRFRSNAAETIGVVRLHTAIVQLGEPATYLVEVTAAGDELVASTADYATDTYAPNVLTVVAGTVVDAGGGAASVADIAEWPPDFTDYVAMGPAASFDLQFASAAVAPGGRVVAVAVEIVTAWSGAANPSEGVRRSVVSLVNGGIEYGTQTRITPLNNSAETAGRNIISWGEINPITGLPWVAADIAALDTATTQVRFARQSGDTGQWRAAAIRLIVAYETVERRVATGVLVTTAAAAADWVPAIDLYQPTTMAANWPKANATDYSLVIRQADQGGLTPFGANYLSHTTLQAAAGEEAPPDLPAYAVSSTTLAVLTDNSTTLETQAPTSETASVGLLLPFVLRTTAPATSDDGQPYAKVRTPGVYSGSGANEQEFRTTSSGFYSGLRIMAGWFGDFPTGDLVVQVKRRSDNVVMGYFEVEPAELTASGVAHAALAVLESKAAAPGIALVSGVQYYLDFTSATPSTGLWLVGLLSTEDGPAGIGSATYATSVDQADPIGGTAAGSLTYAPADFAFLVEAAVDEPSGFAATASIEPLPDEQPCPLDGIPYVLLGWDPTILGADFARYELERLGPDGTTWELIAAITAESDDGFLDLEARLGVEESYRVRVVRTDGASSYYSDVATVTLPAAGCGYTFTSNEEPTMGVGYPDTYQGRPTRTYDFPEAQEVQFRRIYLRDYQIAFHPISRRGVSFERNLVIGGLAAPAAGVGPPAAAMLRDLAWAPISYVCVRDQDGNRWFMNVRVSELRATRYTDVHIHEVTVIAVEVTATPSTPATGTNTAGGPLSFVSGEPIMFVDGTPMDSVT